MRRGLLEYLCECALSSNTNKKNNYDYNCQYKFEYTYQHEKWNIQTLHCSVDGATVSQCQARLALSQVAYDFSGQHLLAHLSGYNPRHFLLAPVMLPQLFDFLKGVVGYTVVWHNRILNSVV